MRRLAATALALAALAGARGAEANGRFPAAGQIVVDPLDPAHLSVRATYGLVVSSDAGGSWRWVCEQSIGYQGVEDPSLGALGQGALVAGLSSGLRVTRDRGCSFATPAGAAATSRIVDVAVERADPTHAVALAVTYVPARAYAVHETLDDGATWTALGTLPAEVSLGVTVDVAPSAPSRLYASGSAGTPVDGVLLRSDDRGAHFTSFPLGIGGDRPFVAAVDPHDPDRVYVRVDGDVTDALLVSDDGGAHVREAFRAKGRLLGFALSPSGARVAVGGPDDGIWVASTSDLAFAQAGAFGPTCLAWTAAGLYACADESTAQFSVGLSTDEGRTVAPLYRQSDLAPLACAASTTTGASCPAFWPAVHQTLVGGAGAALDASRDADDEPAADDAGDAPAPSPRAEAASGSGCALTRQAPGSLLALGALAAALLASRARRRG